MLHKKRVSLLRLLLLIRPDTESNFQEDIKTSFVDGAGGA